MHGERSCLTDFGKSQFCLACTYFQGRPGCPVIGCTVDLPKESCLNYLVIGGGGDTNFSTISLRHFLHHYVISSNECHVR